MDHAPFDESLRVQAIDFVALCLRKSEQQRPGCDFLVSHRESLLPLPARPNAPANRLRRSTSARLPLHGGIHAPFSTCLMGFSAGKANSLVSRRFPSRSRTWPRCCFMLHVSKHAIWSSWFACFAASAPVQFHLALPRLDNRVCVYMYVHVCVLLAAFLKKHEKSDVVSWLSTLGDGGAMQTD